MTRLAVKESTLKRLFALSGNFCAFPNCNQLIVDSGMVIGEVCHIEAAEPGGERYNPNQTDEQRRSFENLILLCPTHHKITDNVAMYPPKALHEMKANHESHFQNKPFDVSNELLVQIFNYDKREAVFDALTHLIRTIMAGTNISFDEIMQFNRATDKADLLFEQDIIDYLDEIQTKANDLFGISQQLQNGGIPVGPKREQLAQKKYDLVIWFGKQSKNSRAKFHKYLHIAKKNVYYLSVKLTRHPPLGLQLYAWLSACSASCAPS